MASEKFIQLLESLRQASLDGRVRWFETDTDQEFKVSLGSVLVEIREETNNYDVYRYVVTLKSGAGKTLELEIFDSQYNTDESRYNLASTLYELARKDALKVDLFIDSAIDYLKKK